jgi:hypothetical protein
MDACDVALLLPVKNPSAANISHMPSGPRWPFTQQALSIAVTELSQQDHWNKTLKLQCLKGNIHVLTYRHFSGFCQGKKQMCPFVS